MNKVEKRIWHTYGKQYAQFFVELQYSQLPHARETAIEMGIRALKYLVRSEIIDEFFTVVSDLVTSTFNPQLLQVVILELQAFIMRAWWQSYKRGDIFATVLDLESLSKALSDADVIIGALDVAREAHSTLKNWQNCLDLVTEKEEIEQIRGDSEHTLTRTRFNRHSYLINLGRLNEAQKVLENCLLIYRNVDDKMGEAKALSGLAHLWYARNDFIQAIALERQALSVKEQFAFFEHRANSHGNLSSYLFMNGQIKEAKYHTLAQIIYDTVTNSQQNLEIGLYNLTYHWSKATQKTISDFLPSIEELLGDPEFNALRYFLEERHVNIQELQETINELLEQVQQQLFEN